MTLFLLALGLGLALRLLLFRRLALPSFRFPLLFLLALLWEGALALLALFRLLPPSLAGPLGQAGAYLLLLPAFALNWSLPPMRLAFLGGVLNGLVILVNGGHMPVDPGALEVAGLGHYRDFLARAGDGLHILASPSTRLLLLGDWIPLPGRVVSPGDLLLAVAVFLLPLLPGSPRGRGGETP